MYVISSIVFLPFLASPINFLCIIVQFTAAANSSFRRIERTLIKHTEIYRSSGIIFKRLHIVATAAIMRHSVPPIPHTFHLPTGNMPGARCRRCSILPRSTICNSYTVYPRLSLSSFALCALERIAELAVRPCVLVAPSKNCNSGFV